MQLFPNYTSTVTQLMLLYLDPYLYPTQGKAKVRLFLGHLQIQDKTGNLSLISLSYLQLLSGTTSLFLNSLTIPLDSG